MSRLYSFPSQPTVVQRDLDFLIISGTKGPRWLIPENPKLGYFALKQWRPYGKISTILWKLLLVLYRYNLVLFLPNVQRLKWALLPTKNNFGILNKYDKDARLIPVIYLGTPNITRKAIVMLIDKQHKKIQKILKLALNSGANENILHEVNILKQLQSKTSLLAPQILHFHTHGDFSIQEALLGKLSNSVFTKQHVQYLLGLRTNKTTNLSIHNQVLKVAVSNLSNITNNQKIFLQNQLIQMNSINRELFFVVLEHGDFAPWNLMQTTQGLQAFDWEDSLVFGLPLQDALHFFEIQAYLFGKKHDFLEYFFKSSLITTYLQELNITQPMAKLLAQYYLLDKLIKRYEKKESMHGYFLYRVLKETDWSII